MIVAISVVFGVLLTAYLYFIYKPLLAAFKLKLKFGNAVVILWKPQLSEFSQMQAKKDIHGDILAQFTKIAQENPEVKFYVTNILDKPLIYITDPEYLKQMYVDHQYYDKYNIFGNTELVHQGLVFSSGTKWRQQRNILTEAFTYDKLKARIPMINDVVSEAINVCQKERILDFTNFIAGEVVIRSFFGEDAKQLLINGKDAKIELVSIFNDLGTLSKQNPLILLKQGLLGQQSWSIFLTSKEKELNERIHGLKQFSKEIIEDRIKNPTKSDHKDFLDVYAAEYLKNKNITIEEMIQQFITLFFAGTDTTATTSFTALYFLAKYPEAQLEILEEIQQIVGNSDVKAENLHHLEKLTAFINEVLRFKNPAWGPLYRIVNKTHKVKDLELQKGWYVQHLQYLTQHCEKYFDNSLEFNYKRFYKQNPIKNDNGFVNVPFSAGGRNCIGQHMALMEIKIIITKILQKYLIELNKDVRVMWDIKFLYTIEQQNIVKLVPRH